MSAAQVVNRTGRRLHGRAHVRPRRPVSLAFFRSRGSMYRSGSAGRVCSKRTPLDRWIGLPGGRSERGYSDGGPATVRKVWPSVICRLTRSATGEPIVGCTNGIRRVQRVWPTHWSSRSSHEGPRGHVNRDVPRSDMAGDAVEPRQCGARRTRCGLFGSGPGGLTEAPWKQEFWHAHTAEMHAGTCCGHGPAPLLLRDHGQVLGRQFRCSPSRLAGPRTVGRQREGGTIMTSVGVDPHVAATVGHQIVQSMEPGPTWRWCYVHENYV